MFYIISSAGPFGPVKYVLLHFASNKPTCSEVGVYNVIEITHIKKTWSKSCHSFHAIEALALPE